MVKLEVKNLKLINPVEDWTEELENYVQKYDKIHCLRLPPKDLYRTKQPKKFTHMGKWASWVEKLKMIKLVDDWTKSRKLCGWCPQIYHHRLSSIGSGRQPPMALRICDIFSLVYLLRICKLFQIFRILFRFKNIMNLFRIF